MSAQILSRQFYSRKLLNHILALAPDVDDLTMFFQTLTKPSETQQLIQAKVSLMDLVQTTSFCIFF